MMKCKEALEAEGGDQQKAIDRLRKEGLKTAESKASRATGEGLVRARVSADGRSGALVSVLCETEPVSRTPMFGDLVDRLLAQVERDGPADVADLLRRKWIDDPAHTVDEALRGVIAKTGENMKISAVHRFHLAGPGVVANYVHHNSKVGVLVAVDAKQATPALAETARQLCMHIAFSKPVATTRAEVPADAVERERGVVREQVAQDPKIKGKPAQVVDKIVEGKLDAFYRERVLLEQLWFQDATKNVTTMLREAGGTLSHWALAVVGGHA
jgi:elongation factor Ts